MFEVYYSSPCTAYQRSPQTLKNLISQYHWGGGEISFLGIIGGKKSHFSISLGKKFLNIIGGKISFLNIIEEKNLISQYYWSPLDFTRAPSPNSFPLSSISHVLHFLPRGQSFPD